TVSAERDRQTERLLGLRRPHRHGDDFPAVLVAQAGRVGDGIRVEAVQLERDAFALQRLRLLVELDRIGARHLLDEADDLHGGETTPPCLACSTTSTGTCRRSSPCSRTPSG